MIDLISREAAWEEIKKVLLINSDRMAFKLQQALWDVPAVDAIPGGCVMKDNSGIIIEILVILAILALSMWLTKLIVNSDLPVWLKVFLLK